MNEFANNMMFSEEEKQALTARLQTAARAKRKPVRLRLRRMVCIAAAAALALTVAAGASGALDGTVGRLKLLVGGQQVEADAVMVMHEDGTATVTVGTEGDSVTITDPSGALTMVVLTGDEQAAQNAAAPIAQERDGEAPPYELYEQDGRVLLHINGYIPIDVTDRLADGVTFVYTDENGTEQTATVSGSANNYTVQ